MACKKLICLLQKVLSVCGQDVVVKEETAIELHPDFENVESGEEMICFATSGSTDSEYQSLNVQEMSTVVLACSEGAPEQTQFAGNHRQLEHNISEILSQELGCSEEGSHQSVESIISANYMGTLVSNEDTTHEFVEQAGNVTYTVKSQSSGKTDVLLRRPIFGTANQDINEVEKASSIHLQPFSLERVGSLKW
jgi:hypothetical protein